MGDWGSFQYDREYETFHRLLNMDRKEALAELKVKELVTVMPETLVEYTSIDNEEEIIKKVPIKQFFNMAKDEAWDLWSATGVACQVLAKGYLPKEQHLNEGTGQECFMLWISGAFGEAKDPDEIFGGFST